MDDTQGSLVLYLYSNPTAVVGLLALVTAIASVAFQRKTSKEKNSLDFQAKYLENPEIRNAWAEIRDVENYSDEQFDKLAIQKGTDVRKSVILLLNEWERAANAIHHGLFDSNYLYQAHGSTVINLYISLLPFIARMQNKQPRAFIGFTKLASRWLNKRGKELSKAKTSRDELKQMLNDLNIAARHFNTYLKHHPNVPYDDHKLKQEYQKFKTESRKFRAIHRKIYISKRKRLWLYITERLLSTHP